MEKCTIPALCQLQEFEEELHEVISQYKNSPNLIGYISSFVDTAKDMRLDINELSIIFNPACISGEVLDLLGRIVGIPRPMIGADGRLWFAYFDGDADPFQAGYGVGQYWDGKISLVGGLPASDKQYRVIILSKIAKNSFKGSHNELLEVVSYITCRSDIFIEGTNGVTVSHDGTVTTTGIMEINIIGIDSPIPTEYQYLFMQFDILPIPAGVKLLDVR
jgi:hypothetical protein